MKALLLFALTLMFALPAQASDYVQGYTRRDGTYVQPHFKTAPDNNAWNNYSTRGNVNPYTGQRGYETPSPSYQPYGSGSGYGGYDSYRGRDNSLNDYLGRRR